MSTHRGWVQPETTRDLLERDDSLACLESARESATAGTGTVVLLSGEAGVGKTSLVRAFCERHTDDALVWWGACDALSTPRPLGPLHDIARAAGGDLGALMRSEAASRYERLSGFVDALSAPRSVISVVEDVHWADDATRDLLVFVTRRIVDTNALVVVTYRDDEVGTDHPLRATLGHLATLDGVRRHVLSRLSRSAVAELAERRGADPARVYEVTGGNPFFVEEVLAAGAGTVPVTVRDAILARALRLSAPAREALKVTSIVPDRAELDLVREVAGGDMAAIEECEHAGLLLGSGAAVRFRHELARLAVEEAIPQARTVDLHARVLRYLERRVIADPARLAYHAERAADSDAVLRHAPVAADQAARLGAHREAQSHLAHAIDHAAALPPAERAGLLERYADECNAAGMFALAVDAAARARAEWQALDDVAQAARMTARQAGPLWNLGRFHDAHACADDAVAMVRDVPPSRAHAYVFARAASLRVISDVDDAVSLGRQAVVLAQDGDDAALLVLSLIRLGVALWQVDPEEAEHTLRRALHVARRSGDDVGTGATLANLGSGAVMARRYAMADRWLQECLDWCAARDLDYYRAHAVSWKARSEFEQGRWAAAAATVDATDAAASAIPQIHTDLRSVLGRLRVRRGDPDAERPLREAMSLAARTRDVERLCPPAAGLAEAAWLSGRDDLIPALVEETYQRALELPHHAWAKGELALWMWRAGAIDRAPEGVAEPYARQIDGDWRAAARAWDDLGCPYEAAVARADSANVGDLLAALEALGRLGARPMADVIAARLRHGGVRALPRRPTRATLENPAGLTNRELEVVTLLTEGRTNPDIAAALHISAKTAGHHVSAIMAKLNVHSRRDAARAAHELGITATASAPRRP